MIGADTDIMLADISTVLSEISIMDSSGEIQQLNGPSP